MLLKMSSIRHFHLLRPPAESQLKHVIMPLPMVGIINPMKNTMPIFILNFLLLILIHSTMISAQNPNATDLMALLDFKNRITDDPLGILESWNDSNNHCAWAGITCDPNNGRVTILDLRSQKLVGSLPPSIGNLSFVEAINLRYNSFNGKIPQEIAFLSNLKQLNLTSNMFSGFIPPNLSSCTQLTHLALEYNQLWGQIPDQLNSLSGLHYLGLGSNNLTGFIPAWIGNFSSRLWAISLALNNFQGEIPQEIGRLSGLRIFQVFGNRISGVIPSSLYNISSMTYFSVTQNQLQGEIPPDIGLRFPNLEIFAGGVNNFTGIIPVSLSNCSRLALIDFAQNHLTGTVPSALGSLPGLYRINFDANYLGIGEDGDMNFVNSLVNCTNLEVLGLSSNFFGAELPPSVANLSTSLKILTLGGNVMHGNIPSGMGNLINLTLLGLEGNYYTGSIPDDFGKLEKLGQLHLTGNEISGKIPFTLGNLTSLSLLHLDSNRLQGRIPPALGKLTGLIDMTLSGNNLTGKIPKEIMSLSSLSIFFGLARNSLSGTIPIEVGKLINLKELDISQNRLSGEIPSELSMCLSLEILRVGGNLFHGSIPGSLAALKGLEQLNLSHNNLSGKIPDFFEKLPFIKKLDLSFNNLEGEVPNLGIFSNASAISVLGNENLCGGAPSLHLPPCSKKPVRKSLNKKFMIPMSVVSTIILILLCWISSYYVACRKPRNQNIEESSRQDLELAMSYSYQELYKSTNGFSSDNLIGSGSFGSVYKGVLDESSSPVAVKVLNLRQKGASRSFLDECAALQSIRHRNLLKIITTCSSVDRQGNEFKCLVFEFMANGSLDEWLHSSMNARKRRKNFSIIERLNIAIDVASALDYLHNYCHTPIVHCDLKPSNVLLNEDFTAHVGDFGLAKFLLGAPNRPLKNQDVSVELKGSIGYIPPEYGTSSKISPLGDVYSYGILVLELFTGKRPTDNRFKDGLSIHNYVAMSLPEHVVDVLDPSVIVTETECKTAEKNVAESEEISLVYKTRDFHQIDTIEMECLISVFKIGLSCSMPLPKDRMPIGAAVNQLQAIRDLLCSKEKR